MGRKIKNLLFFCLLFFIHSCVIVINPETQKKEPQKDTTLETQTFKRTVAVPVLPDDVKILNRIGESANERGNYNKAVKCYKKAIEINPNFIISYHNLGVTYFNQGKYKESKKQFKKYELLQEIKNKK